MSGKTLMFLFLALLIAVPLVFVIGAVAVSNPPTLASAAPEEVVGTATTVPTETAVPITATPDPTDTATPTQIPTETPVPLRKADFSINGQIFIDLCARLVELSVAHNCPVVEHVSVPVDVVEGEYFIAFLDHPGLGLFYQPGGEYFCGVNIGVECTVWYLMLHDASISRPNQREYHLGGNWYVFFTMEITLENINRYLSDPKVPQVAKEQVILAYPVYFNLGVPADTILNEEMGLEVLLKDFGLLSP